MSVRALFVSLHLTDETVGLLMNEISECIYAAGTSLVATASPTANDTNWTWCELVHSASWCTPVYYPSDPQIHDEIVYIGGVPEHLVNHLPSALRSGKGFIGCMATLIVNGRAYNLQTIAASIAVSALTAECTDSERSFLLLNFVRCSQLILNLKRDVEYTTNKPVFDMFCEIN